jgi:hypothetical protein
MEVVMVDYVAEGLRIFYKWADKIPKGRVAMVFTVSKHQHNEAVRNAERLGLSLDQYNQEAYIKGCFYMVQEYGLYEIEE